MGRSAAFIASLLLCVGCADSDYEPMRLGAPPPADDFELDQADFAILGAQPSGGWSIRLLDGEGELARLPVDLEMPRGLIVHPDGFFLVRDRRDILRVELDGSVFAFGPEDLDYFHGMSVTPSGSVVVAAESEVWELDPFGTPTGYAETADEYCWMDVAAGPAGSIAVDQWGSTLASFHGEQGRLKETARLPVSGLTLAVQTEDGSSWAAARDRDQAFVVDPEGRVTELRLDPQAIAVSGLVDSLEGGVLVAVQRDHGAALVEVRSDGDRRDRLEEPGGHWIDIAAVP